MEKQTEMIYQVRSVLSIRDLAEESCEIYRDRTAFLWDENGTVVTKTYAQVFADIRAFATYLNSLGLTGKKIAVIGKNSYGWALTYLSVCSGVGVIVPIDKELRGEEIRGLLLDSGAAAIVCGRETVKKLSDCSDAATVPGKTADGQMLLDLGALAQYLCVGRTLLAAGDDSYRMHQVDPYALGVLLYTSGTTGVSKGVMLSQYNICSDIVQVCRRVRVDPEDRCLSMLPLHHTYECTAGFLTFFYCGASIAYNTSLRTLQPDLLRFHPTVLVAVPLVLETFYKTIQKKYEKIKGGKTVLKLQLARAGLTKNMETRRKIFHAVGQAFGGKLNRILIGAAPLQTEIFEAYAIFGYPVYVGYGLTETAPVCMMHTDAYQAPGDVGYPLLGVEAKLVQCNEDGVGELLVRGSNVMLGYYNNPEATAAVMTDGWFDTGDLARKTEKGTYVICGRHKSMIVLKNGKKVFPEELEQYLNQSQYVSECLVFAQEIQNEIVITAAVYPDMDCIKEAYTKKNGEGASEPDADFVRRLLQEAAEQVNRQFPAYKAIRRLLIRKEAFEMTTTRKVKRMAQSNLSGESAELRKM